MNKSISRRDIMGRLSLAAGVPLGSSLLADAAQQASGDDDVRGPATYDIRRYGAKGDGKTLDSKAFQGAIDACAQDGGGTVLVPAGEFLVGSVQLKSNVTIHLAARAHLLGSTSTGD